LLALENTFHGKLIPASYIQAATDWARSVGLGTHLDGARVFNAAVASGKPLADMCEPFDSVSICFSKGLGAPVGSVLVGSQGLISRARRWRKMLGGGLRQSGVLAAACLYALEHNVDRLADDHANARALAEGLRGIRGVKVLSQDTNMLFVQFEPARCDALTAALANEDILLRAVYDGPTRLVTHLDVSADDVQRVIQAVAKHLR
jgi:threonine aldolase